MTLSTVVDAQVVELLGRDQLVDELLPAGLEVAVPMRDRGIDLIAYADLATDVEAFTADATPPPRPSRRVRQLLEPYARTPERWWTKITNGTNRS